MPGYSHQHVVSETVFLWLSICLSVSLSLSLVHVCLPVCLVSLACSSSGVQLLQSVDPHKDQTYFLSQVSQVTCSYLSLSLPSSLAASCLIPPPSLLPFLLSSFPFFFSQSALRRTLFPIGHLCKRQVRRIAVEAGFKSVAERKEVMGREEETGRGGYGDYFTYRVWVCASLERDTSLNFSAR